MALNLKDRWNQLSERVSQASIVVRARTLFESLSPRDRRLLLLLVGFFTLALIGAGSLASRNYVRRLEQEITRKQGQFDRVEQVRSEHDALKAEIATKEQELKQDQNF